MKKEEKQEKVKVLNRLLVCPLVVHRLLVHRSPIIQRRREDRKKNESMKSLRREEYCEENLESVPARGFVKKVKR